MKLSDSIAGLRRLVGRQTSPEEQERLLELYRNRAELKKEFSRLQDENYSLQQQLKQCDHSQIQTQQRLTQLEEFLGKPENGLPTLVFYQLRALWHQACRRLQELNSELSAQQQDRERRLQVMEFDQHRQRALAEIDKALLDAQSLADAVDARVQMMQRRLDELRWFWYYRRRHALQTEMQAVQREQQDAHRELADLQDQRASLVAAVCPEFPGLTVDGKRLVNTATLAYAQQLLERLGKVGLAPLCKAAAMRSVLEASYGATAECQFWLDRINTIAQQLQTAPRDITHLKQNTLRLRNNAFYRTDHDTVPVPESIGLVTVSKIETGSEPHEVIQEEVNALLDDYWNLYDVLLH